jgi:hypothetical protein
MLFTVVRFSLVLELGAGNAGAPSIPNAEAFGDTFGI